MYVIVFVNTGYVFVVVLKYRPKYLADSDLDLMQKNVIEQSIPQNRASCTKPELSINVAVCLSGLF